MQHLGNNDIGFKIKRDIGRNDIGVNGEANVQDDISAKGKADVQNGITHSPKTSSPELIIIIIVNKLKS